MAHKKARTRGDRVVRQSPFPNREFLPRRPHIPKEELIEPRTQGSIRIINRLRRKPKRGML
jgi:hypothetical protein